MLIYKKDKKHVLIFYNKKMSPYYAQHLSMHEKIILGGFYTPPDIIRKVEEMVKPFLNFDNLIIADLAGGCGAFILPFQHYNYRIADCDEKAVEYLKSYFNHQNVILTNSLTDVSRKKFNIPENSFLIIVGNPPYNDTTSEYKKGQKGNVISDPDIYDRDLGISFLKFFNKLKADVICILHPLSYLIKEANFKRLKSFACNYKLIESFIFPSTKFKDTSEVSAFPVTISLYLRDKNGMSYDNIKNFRFKILDDEKKTFIVSRYTTTDGYINKYPPRKNDIMKESPLNIYYYSFRDLNSILRNASFIDKKYANSVVVTLENLYKYAYLYVIKKLLKFKNKWLFGNMSPLVDIDYVESNKELMVYYVIKTHPLFKNMEKNKLNLIKKYYNLNNKSFEIYSLEEKFLTKLKDLYEI